MKGYDLQVVAMFLKSKSEVNMNHRFRLYKLTKGINQATHHSMIVPICVSELRKICRRTDPKKQSFYQISEQISPGLDIGKGCPEIARLENFSYLATGYLKCGI